MAITVIALVEKLRILAIDEANYLSTIKSEVKSLHTQLDMMKAFLEDTDAIFHRSERAKQWVKRLRELAFEVEDIIDIFVYKVAWNWRDNPVKKISKFPKFLIDVHQLRGNIEDLKEKMKMHFDDRVNYDIKPLEECQSSTQTHLPEISLVVQNYCHVVHVVGLQTEEEELVKLLMEKEPQMPFGVVSITGMGGLGKSTLASKIFHNDEVRRHFDCQAYVTISKEYSMSNILCKIIKQVMLELKEEERNALALMNAEILEEKLYKVLKNKKSYLIVLDDVWRKEDWDSLLCSLPIPCHGQQCRVLLTTRIDDVARHADPNAIPYKKKFMDGQNSLNLFWKKFFSSQDDEVIEARLKDFGNEMKNLAMQFVRKCDGLPLAILVLAGLLSERRQKSFAQWKSILDRVDWHLKEGNCEKVLSLSYIELPFHLKPCFLYFGVFPEDIEIKRGRLIQLWAAEGFLGSSRMEDLGKEYLEELMQRNLIQVAEWKSNGEPESFIIQDLLLSLATSKAKEGMFLNISTPNEALLNCYHRLALHEKRSSDEENMADDECSYYSYSSSMSSPYLLRSLLCFIAMSQSSLYGQCKLLNVLDLEVAPGIEDLPKAIKKLIFLKYLRVRGDSLRILPCWVGNLSNLQTLDLVYTVVRSIPSEILKLHKLRHLLCRPGARLVPAYESIGKKNAFGISRCRPHDNRSIGELCDLQMLWLHLDDWIVDGLGMLTGLRNLWAFNLEDSETMSLKLSEALLKLVRLEFLRLPVNDKISLPSFSKHVYLYEILLIGSMQKLPDHNNFPPNLASLCLHKTHLEEDMMVVLEQLPRLKKLRLYQAYDRVEMKCSARGFPELESLFLEYFHSLQYWEVEKGAMPNLKTLEIIGLCELKWIPDGFRHITTLKKLTLNMPIELLERIKEVGDDWEKIKHVPSIHTTRYW